MSEASQHIQLGTHSCDVEGLFPAVAGADTLVRFAALGKNGRMSAWSDVLKIHLPEACDALEDGALAVEVTLAGDDAPFACTSTVGPLDDGPLPGEPEIGPGSEDESPEEDDSGDDAVESCSSTGVDGTVLFGLLAWLARRGNWRTNRHRHIR